MNILVLNAGSKTFKASVYSAEHVQSGELSPAPMWTAQINWQEKNCRSSISGKPVIERRIDSGNSDQAVRTLLKSLWDGECAVVSQASDIQMVGHRVVHGGAKYIQSTMISPTVLHDLRGLIELAPDHEPSNIMGIEIAAEVLPLAKQVAVFDTAFHSSMPESATIYAGPYEWYDQLNIRRFGFHGISHAYCTLRTAELIGRTASTLSMIVCHLGGGSSVSAVKNGVSVMTTMGFTPLDGLVMSTRSGSLDPGLLMYLLQKKIYSVDELSDVLHNCSGLKGISGLSGDMREIEEAAAQHNSRARLAFDVYVQSVAANIGAMSSYLENLDAVVFTGGIGENSSQVRDAVCKRLQLLHLAVDEQKNKSVDGDMNIQRAESGAHLYVIHTREDLLVARETFYQINAVSQ